MNSIFFNDFGKRKLLKYSVPYGQTCEQQQQLVEAGGADLVACMLCSPVSRVQLPALHCLAAMCYK